MLTQHGWLFLSGTSYIRDFDTDYAFNIIDINSNIETIIKYLTHSQAKDNEIV